MRRLACFLALLLFVPACSSGGPEDTGALLDVETFPEQRVDVYLSEEAVRQMVDGEIELPDYNSDPPTSGPHASRPAACGVFRQPVPDVYQVHDLAIGVVVIQYGEFLEDSEVERIENLARRLGERVIVAPRSGMAAPVVATAWATMMRLDGVDEDALEAFYNTYVGRGPESGSCPIAVDEGA